MDVKDLDNKLADYPYVNGYTPSQADLEQLKKLPSSYDKYVHVKRWAKHMASFSDEEKKAFPGAPSAASAPSKAKPAPAPAAADDDDEIDLFGSDDDEEAEKAKQERAKQMAAQKKGVKPGVVAKSSVVLDVKVWDDETEIKAVETKVRAIQMDGLVWGAAKIMPVAFGMNKLQILCVVEDEKVSIDTLTEQIEELEDVQSTDIVAFQKI